MGRTFQSSITATRCIALTYKVTYRVTATSLTEGDSESLEVVGEYRPGAVSDDKNIESSLVSYSLPAVIRLRLRLILKILLITSLLRSGRVRVIVGGVFRFLLLTPSITSTPPCILRSGWY